MHIVCIFGVLGPLSYFRNDTFLLGGFWDFSRQLGGWVGPTISPLSLGVGYDSSQSLGSGQNLCDGGP